MQDTRGASLEKILNSPLNYITPQQRKTYRLKVIRRAAIFIAIGLIIFTIELMRLSTISNDFNNFANTSSYRGSLELAWYLSMYLLPLRGLYLLITVKKHMSNYAIQQLSRSFPALAELNVRRQKTAYKKLSAAMNRLGHIATLILIVMITVFVIVIIGAIVVMTSSA